MKKPYDIRKSAIGFKQPLVSNAIQACLKRELSIDTELDHILFITTFSNHGKYSIVKWNKAICWLWAICKALNKNINIVI